MISRDFIIKIEGVVTPNRSLRCACLPSASRREKRRVTLR